ncbi:MAG: NTP transferase domain-containing protein [Bacteroidales bacterium]|nr:NTP transferase domain-containing protein [Bacteroidales bacterium]
MKTKAMIFAAGLGTRLYPLTQDRPKALVEIHGKTLLETVIRRITDAGIHEIVVNVHHFSGLVKEFLSTHTFEADILVSDETQFLLDTAGGLKFAEPLLHDADHILLHNVDILSDLDLKKMIDSHIDSHAWATLAVRERETSRYLLFEKATMRLCGWKNVKSGEIRQILPMKEELALGFSGIHVVKREILDLIPAGQKLSMTPLYLDLAQDHTINGYMHPEGQWMDVGKYEDVKKLMGDF